MPLKEPSQIQPVFSSGRRRRISLNWLKKEGREYKEVNRRTSQKLSRRKERQIAKLRGNLIQISHSKRAASEINISNQKLLSFAAVP